MLNIRYGLNPLPQFHQEEKLVGIQSTEYGRRNRFLLILCYNKTATSGFEYSSIGSLFVYHARSLGIDPNTE